MILLRYGSATDVGMVREVNQDSFLIAEPLFAVADGMGGHQGGEVASATALEVLKETFFARPTPNGLIDSVIKANSKVWGKAQLDSKLHGMGTTLTAVALITPITPSADELNQLAVINVGDSRTYLFRNNELSQITADHSFVEDLVRSGQITAEDAEHHPKRNILTRALGVEPSVKPDLLMVSGFDHDRFLLCSDGLVRELNSNQIAAILRRYENPTDAASELVQQAKAHGGHDNITVVIIDIVSGSPSPNGNITNNDTSMYSMPQGSYESQLNEEFSPVAPLPDISQDQDNRDRDQPKGRSRNREAHPPRDFITKVERKITFRVIGFFLAIIALLGVGVGTVVWYARASYFVGIEGEQLAIYRGRPENVLWFEPTITERTNINTSNILPNRLAPLIKGVPFSSIEESRSYITNLTAEADKARAASGQLTDPSNASANLNPSTDSSSVNTGSNTDTNSGGNTSSPSSSPKLIDPKTQQAQ